MDHLQAGFGGAYLEKNILVYASPRDTSKRKWISVVGGTVRLLEVAAAVAIAPYDFVLITKVTPTEAGAARQQLIQAR